MQALVMGRLTRELPGCHLSAWRGLDQALVARFGERGRADRPCLPRSNAVLVRWAGLRAQELHEYGPERRGVHYHSFAIIARTKGAKAPPAGARRDGPVDPVAEGRLRPSPVSREPA
ncbi:MAG: hypothetical protein AAF371_15405 [Pseudomonadota bacterium]